MIYTLPWAPVIALATVLLLFMVVPLVAFVALATMLLALALVLASTFVVAVLTVPPLAYAAVRQRLPRRRLAHLRLGSRPRRAAVIADPRLERVP
jgi:small-conductance mechanosensitive channel